MINWIKCSDKLPPLDIEDIEDDVKKSIRVLCSNGTDIWMGFYTDNQDGTYPLMRNDTRIGQKGWWTDTGYSCCSNPDDEEYIWWALPNFPKDL